VQLVTGVRYQESTSGCTSVLLGIQFKECAVLDLACRCAPTEWQRTGQACVRAAHLTPQVVCARKELKGNMHRGSEGRGEAQGSAGGGGGFDCALQTCTSCHVLVVYQFATCWAWTTSLAGCCGAPLL
jgi:hypothetical protein